MITRNNRSRWKKKQKKKRELGPQSAVKVIRICGQKSSGGVGEKVMNEGSGRGHYGKRQLRALFSNSFSSRFGRMKFVDSGKKIFSRVFYPQYFPPFTN